MSKFLVETTCAEDDAIGHQLFWCSHCNNNKVDSLEHSTGRFFCLSGHELGTNSVGECKKVIFAVCTECLATNLWDTKPPEDMYLSPSKETKMVKLPLNWKQVMDNNIFIYSLENNDTESAIDVATELMECSRDVAKTLVYSLS